MTISFASMRHQGVQGTKYRTAMFHLGVAVSSSLFAPAPAAARSFSSRSFSSVVFLFLVAAMTDSLNDTRIISSTH